MAPSLGVDFGTSHTVAVLRRDGQAPQPLLFDGSPLLSSAVHVEPDGTVLVGRDALHSARLRPERFEPNPKRRVDDGTVLLADAEIPVVDLFAAVLARVRAEAERVAGTADLDTVVTHPAVWGAARRLLLTDACAAAGLNRVTAVAEPVAAARYFGHRPGVELAPGSAVVVYDFGGGTFDASVVAATGTGFEVLAVDGLDSLGGVDIDHAIVEHLGRRFGSDERWAKLLAPADANGRRQYRSFMDDVRGAKERLSRQSRVELLVPVLETDTHLTREELEAICEPMLAKAVRLTEAVIRVAAVPPERIAGVFLVGGASRMPLAATSLHRGVGIAPTVIDQPELVVATGAITAPGTAAAGTFPLPGWTGPAAPLVGSPSSASTGIAAPGPAPAAAAASGGPDAASSAGAAVPGSAAQPVTPGPAAAPGTPPSPLSPATGAAAAGAVPASAAAAVPGSTAAPGAPPTPPPATGSAGAASAASGQPASRPASATADSGPALATGPAGSGTAAPGSASQPVATGPAAVPGNPPLASPSATGAAGAGTAPAASGQPAPRPASATAATGPAAAAASPPPGPLRVPQQANSTARPAGPAPSPPPPGSLSKPLKLLLWIQFAFLTGLGLFAVSTFFFDPPPTAFIWTGAIALGLSPFALAVPTALNAVRLDREPARTRRSIVITQTLSLLHASAGASFIVLVGMPGPPLIRLLLAVMIVIAGLILGLARLHEPASPTPGWRGPKSLRTTLTVQCGLMVPAALVVIAWWISLASSGEPVIGAERWLGFPVVTIVMSLILLGTIALLATGLARTDAASVPDRSRTVRVEWLWLGLVAIYATGWVATYENRLLPTLSDAAVTAAGGQAAWDYEGGLTVFNDLALWLTVASAIPAILAIVQYLRMPAPTARRSE